MHCEMGIEMIVYNKKGNMFSRAFSMSDSYCRMVFCNRLSDCNLYLRERGFRFPKKRRCVSIRSLSFISRKIRFRLIVGQRYGFSRTRQVDRYEKRVLKKVLILLYPEMLRLFLVKTNLG